MENVQFRALRFVFNAFRASYSNLRSRPWLYIDRWNAIATEGFRMYSNVPTGYNRGILIKR